MAKKGGLGRGLDSLITSEYKKAATDAPAKVEKRVRKKKSTEEELSTKTVDNVDKIVDNSLKNVVEGAQMLKMVDVEPNRDQPRKNFDVEALEELTESIRQYGVLQPLLVKAVEDHYVIVAGERRWRAAKDAGLTEIPAIVKNYTDQEIMEIALIENIQREDLNVIEEARGYQRLIQEFGYRQEDLAAKLSRSRTAITNRMRLLKLCEQVQSMVMENSITEGHARALIPIEDAELQFKTAMQVMDGHLSVRETERLVKSILEPKPEVEDWKSADQMFYTAYEEKLKEAMGTKVSIQRKNKDKGHIVIDYYSVPELERLMELLNRH